MVYVWIYKDLLINSSTKVLFLRNYFLTNKVGKFSYDCNFPQAEEQNWVIQGRIDDLRKGVQDASGMADAVKKVPFVFGDLFPPLSNG